MDFGHGLSGAMPFLRWILHEWIVVQKNELKECAQVKFGYVFQMLGRLLDRNTKMWEGPKGWFL